MKRQGDLKHQVQGNSTQLLAWPVEVRQARGMKVRGSMCRAQPVGSWLLVF